MTQNTDAEPLTRTYCGVAGPSDGELLAEWNRVSAITDAGKRRLAVMRAVLAKWGNAPTTQAAPQPAAQQGDALTYEQAHAIRQGHEIASSDAYFEARPQIDCNDRRNVFRAGFERGWDAARAQAKEGGK